MACFHKIDVSQEVSYGIRKQEKMEETVEG